MKVIIPLLALCIGVQAVFSQEMLKVVVLRQEILKPELVGETKETTTSIFPFPANDIVAGDRKITVKVTNNLKHSVFIFGDAFDQDFNPSGFLISRVESDRKWAVPQPSRKLAEERQMIKKDRKILKPNDSFEFSILLSSEADQGLAFRRTIYFCSLPCNEPIEIYSPAFTIEK